MVVCKMRMEFSSVFFRPGIYLRPPFLYHQSIMVLVQVNIDVLVEVSKLNTFIRPHFSVPREKLIHWLMILKMDDTR